MAYINDTKYSLKADIETRSIKSPLLKIPFDGNLIQLLSSCAVSPRFKNVAALKRLLGIKLSTEELLLEFNDHTSPLYKMLCAAMISLGNLIENNNKFELQMKAVIEHERAKDAEIGGIEVERLGEKERFKFIRDLDLRLAAKKLEELQRSATIVSEFQKLQLQKIQELFYWSSKTSDKRILNIMHLTVTVIYSYRESNLHTLSRAQQRLLDPNLSASTRQSIQEEIDAYNDHVNYYTPERRQHVLTNYINDVVKFEEMAEKFVNIEKMAKINLTNVEFIDNHAESSTHKIIHTLESIQSKNISEHYNNLLKTLPKILFRDRESVAKEIDKIDLADLACELSKKPNKQKQNLLENLVKKVARGSDSSVVKNYFNEWLKEEETINTFQEQSASKGPMVTKVMGNDNRSEYRALEKEQEDKREIKPTPQGDHNNKDINLEQRHSEENKFINQKTAETSQNQGRLGQFLEEKEFKINGKDRASCKRVLEAIFELIRKEGLPAEAKDNLEKIARIINFFLGSSRMLKLEINGYTDSVISSYQVLLDYQSSILDFSELRKAIIDLSFIDADKLTPPLSDKEIDLGF